MVNILHCKRYATILYDHLGVEFNQQSNYDPSGKEDSYLWKLFTILAVLFYPPFLLCYHVIIMLWNLLLESTNFSK